MQAISSIAIRSVVWDLFHSEMNQECHPHKASKYHLPEPLHSCLLCSGGPAYHHNLVLQNHHCPRASSQNCCGYLTLQSSEINVSLYVLRCSVSIPVRKDSPSSSWIKTFTILPLAHDTMFFNDILSDKAHYLLQ